MGRVARCISLVGNNPVLVVFERDERTHRSLAGTSRKLKVMNTRAKTLWIPGLVSLTVSMVWRTILQQTAGLPQNLVNHAGLSPQRYVLWLIALPLFGATSAYLSRHSGGNRSSAATAAVFPSIIMMPLWTVLATRMVHPSPAQWFGLLSGVLNWIVLPGIAALVGASPFLKSHSVADNPPFTEL